jgi:hypothetical protein
MKQFVQKTLILGGVLLALGMQACMEVGPAVNMGLNTSLSDTTYVDPDASTPQPRLVLLEEFTGVRCVNCPRAHNTILNLQSTYPNRIVPVGIHTGIFSAPYAGRNDFRIPEGNSLENLMGGAQGYPAGSVNRKKFPDESRIIISDQKWSNYVGGELAGGAPINIEMNRDLDVSAMKMSIEVKVKINQAQEGPLHLTLYLTEDNIVDFQLTPTGVDSAYVHKHVLRKCVTAYNGINLASSSYEANRVFVYRFITDLESAWNLSNCKVVGFVHRIGEVPEVIQTAYINVN